jgi:hypothetical protein
MKNQFTDFEMSPPNLEIGMVVHPDVFHLRRIETKYLVGFTDLEDEVA